MAPLVLHPTFKEFAALARKGNLIPVSVEVVADAVTPVSLLASGWDKNRSCFLLESVEGGERFGRYSIVSLEPEMTLEEKAGVSTFTDRKGKVISSEDEAASDALARHMRAIKAVDVPGMPRLFGGAAGYFSYETVHNFERIPLTKPDRLKWARAAFLIGGDFFVFDHLQQVLKIVASVRVDKPSRAKAAYEEARRRLTRNVDLVRNHRTAAPATRSKRVTPTEFKSNLTRAEFIKAVKKGKEYIGKGDIFQVVLSRRQEKKTSASPLDIYRCLRVVNPSPYMYLFKFGDRAVIGSSPEALVRLENGIATTRPIAGTRGRSENAKEDLALEKSLMADPKERAEHLMLVDLGRNDIGRVCDYGTVKVSNFMSVERYSHVMHIVSEVNGRVKKGKDGFDLLRSAFPAGTVSGAPKIRAMEIIDELEPEQRGPYAGAIGYYSYSGNADMAITIRTLLWKDGVVSIQTGAGIVADSDPAAEFQETENKAAGMKRTVQLAEAGTLLGAHK